MAFNPLQNTWWNQNPRQRAIQDESTKFPWITKSDEARIMNIARSQAHSSYEEDLIVNDLYKKALKNQNSINFSNNRQDAKQEMYKQALDTKNKNQSNQLKSTERTAEVADMIRNYARNNWYWAELEWWNDTKVIEWFTKSNVMAKNEIQDYINWDESSFSFSKRMWFWAWSERSRFDMVTENKWEWNDDILWHFETESYEDADNKVGTRFKNLGKSAYNLASDITNMVANPLDTVNNLWKAAVGGVANLLDVDDEVSQWGDRFESANQVADGMGDFLKNRYGWVDQIANSLYQDPVWVISDIASIATWWAGLVKWGATATAKTAAKVWAKSTAKAAGKIANIADDVMKAWIKYDPATQIMNAEWKVLKWAYKGAKATAKAVANPIESIKKWATAVSDTMDKIWEYWAKKVTWTSTAQDKLYKAQEPRMNTLTRNKDLEKRRANSERANELIVENGYKPTDTSSRVLAHEATMRKVWQQVENAINGGEAVFVDQSRLASKLFNYINEQKKLWSSFNEADIAALERELKTLEWQAIDVPTLEKKKQLYNSIINNWGEQKVSDVFANWIKELTHEIWVIEDSILAEIPWEFQKLKNDFWALADTYEDVFKADMKNQRKKGVWLTETYSRIEWAGDMINGALSIFNGWAKDIIKWAWKVIIWKSLQKARDLDFLVKEWFDELVNNRAAAKAEEAVKPAPAPKNTTAREEIRESAIPKISKEFTREEMDNFKWSATKDQTVEEVIQQFQNDAKSYESMWEKYTLNNLLKNTPKYKAAKIEYDKFLKNMADEVEWKPLLPSLKILKSDGSFNWNGIKRALEKAFSKENWIDDVTDIVRGTVAMVDDEWMNRVIERANKNWRKIDDKFTKPTDLGYTDLSFIYETKNWIKAEVQINTPEMLVAKEWEEAIKMWIIDKADYDKLVKKAGVEWWLWHKYYEEWRDLDKALEKETLKWADAEKARARKKEIEKMSTEYYEKFKKAYKEMTKWK